MLFLFLHNVDENLYIIPCIYIYNILPFVLQCNTYAVVNQTATLIYETIIQRKFETVDGVN